MKHLKVLAIVMLLSILTGCAPSQEQRYEITAQALEELNANSYFGGHQLGEPASVTQTLFEEAGGWPTRYPSRDGTVWIMRWDVDMSVWVPTYNWLFNYNGIYGGGGAYPINNEQDSLTYIKISARASETNWNVYGITRDTPYLEAKEILQDAGFVRMSRWDPFYQWYKDFINRVPLSRRKHIRDSFFIRGDLIIFLPHYLKDADGFTGISVILCDPQNTEYLESIKDQLKFTHI